MEKKKKKTHIAHTSRAILQELEDFLQKCFQKDLNKRWTSAELLKHDWIRKNVKVCDIFFVAFCNGGGFFGHISTLYGR